MSRCALAVLALAMVLAPGCGRESGSTAAGDLTAFTVTELLGIGCTGIWTSDGSGTLRWLAGRGGGSRESPAYPAFRHDGRLTVGLKHPPENDYPLKDWPLIDVVSLDEGRLIAARVEYSLIAWSPGRAQLLALALNREGTDFSLVRIDADSGRTKTIAPSAGFTFAWLGDGDSIAYLTFEDQDASLWVANADGDEARRLASNVALQFAASADGEQIAFRRSRAQDLLEELWVVDVETGDERRLPGPPLPDFLTPDVWVGPDAVVVHEEFPGAGSEAVDAIRVEVGSGARSVLARDLEIVEASRDGSRLLAVRVPALRDDPDTPLIAVVTMRSDGTDERLLAVTDAGLLNLGNTPVLQPVKRELSAAESLAAPPGAEQRCREMLLALRAKVRS